MVNEQARQTRVGLRIDLRRKQRIGDTTPDFRVDADEPKPEISTGHQRHLFTKRKCLVVVIPRYRDLTTWKDKYLSLSLLLKNI